MAKKEFTMSIHPTFESIVLFKGTGKKQTTKEVNLISYGGGDYKVDIRSWYVDDDGEKKMSKGITLTAEEAKMVLKPAVMKKIEAALAK